MKRFAACLLVVLAAPVLAQNSSNVDAQLLAAQMAYQAADGKQEQARRQLQQSHAQGYRHDEAERPRHVAEAVDVAQAGGEADLEQAAEHQPGPRHQRVPVL